MHLDIQWHPNIDPQTVTRTAIASRSDIPPYRYRQELLMSIRTDHAAGLYLDGIRDGHLREALDRHVGARYTQHSTGVADGKEGFLAVTPTG